MYKVSTGLLRFTRMNPYHDRVWFRNDRKRKGLGGMFILGYLLKAMAEVMDLVLLFFMVVVIARAVLSWVSPDPYNPIVRFIHNITEPILYRIRTMLPVVIGGIDLSPILVFLCVIFLRSFVVNSLFRLAETLL